MDYSWSSGTTWSQCDCFTEWFRKAIPWCEETEQAAEARNVFKQQYRYHEHARYHEMSLNNNIGIIACYMKTQADGKHQLEQSACEAARPQEREEAPGAQLWPRSCLCHFSGKRAQAPCSSSPHSCIQPLRMGTAKLAGKKTKSNFIFKKANQSLWKGR